MIFIEFEQKGKGDRNEPRSHNQHFLSKTSRTLATAAHPDSPFSKFINCLALVGMAVNCVSVQIFWLGFAKAPGVSSHPSF